MDFGHLRSGDPSCRSSQPAKSGVGNRGLRIVGVVADAVHLDADDVRPVTGRIGGHGFELFVWPPGRLSVAVSFGIQEQGTCAELAVRSRER
jgi:hypothetical protein